MTTFFFSKDAKTHTDPGRCGFCGHSVQYHGPYRRKTGHTGACTVTDMFGAKCPCQNCVKPQKKN